MDTYVVSRILQYHCLKEVLIGSYFRVSQRRKDFESVSRATPLQTCDLLDHFPIAALFMSGKIDVNKRRPTISKSKVLKLGEAFKVDMEWEAVISFELQEFGVYKETASC